MPFPVRAYGGHSGNSVGAVIVNQPRGSMLVSRLAGPTAQREGTSIVVGLVAAGQLAVHNAIASAGLGALWCCVASPYDLMMEGNENKS